MTLPHSWAPSRAVFVRRVLLNGALTFVVFVVLILLSGFTRDYTQGRAVLFAAGIPLVMTVILMLDDALRWRRVRAETWEVDQGQLIHDGPEGRAMIPLGEITAVQTKLGGAVMIRLTSGKRVLMRYLERPADVVAALNAVLPG